MNIPRVRRLGQLLTDHIYRSIETARAGGAPSAAVPVCVGASLLKLRGKLAPQTKLSEG